MVNVPDPGARLSEIVRHHGPRAPRGSDCPQCGRWNHARDRACEKCGYEFPAPPPGRLRRLVRRLTSRGA